LSLTPSHMYAKVILQGETGTPFWHPVEAGIGSVQSLIVTVEAVTANTHQVSVSNGDVQILTLDAGPANAGRTYFMLGSASGTSPGIQVGPGLVLPLNPDSYFRFTRSTPNSAILQNSMGVLDAHGKATVTFHPTSSFEGQALDHAFLLLNPVDFVSEAEPVQVVH